MSLPEVVNATHSDARPATPSHYGLAVLSLALGGFAIGTTEFVTMGLLPKIADGVDVSVPTAGHVISAYAVGVVVGAPLLAVWGAKLARKPLLLGLMGAYAVLNLLTAFTPGYHLLLVVRFLDGLPHGAYFGIAALVAAALAPPARKGRAVASVMLGLSVANVAGVPAATWLGQHLGWRSAYVATALIAFLTVAMVAAFVPATPADPAATGRRELQAFRSSQVWLTLAAGAIGFGGLFAVYSYIAKTVTVVGGLSEGSVPLFLLGFGLGMVAGTWLAGELAGWSVFGSLIGSGSATGVALLIFWVVAPHGWWLLPVVFAITALSSVLVVNLQLRLMDVAGEAQTLGAAMNHASLNVANALGAWVGGIVIAAGHGYRSPALVGAALSVAGVLVLLWSVADQRRVSRHSSTSTS